MRNQGFIDIDMSRIKNNRLTERVNAQFRFEVFNVLNRVNLQNVNGNLASSTFGRSTATFDPRIIQLGACLTFESAASAASSQRRRRELPPSPFRSK